MRITKTLLRHAISKTLYRSRIPLILTKGKIVILMYHRVLDGEHKLNIQPGMYVTKSTFEMHLKYLKEYFEVVSLTTNILTNQHNQHSQHGHNQRPICAITFDDGWRDNFINAYPILKKYNIPATIFLPTSYIGTTNWFWPEKIAFLLNSVSPTQLSDQALQEVSGIMKEYNIHYLWRSILSPVNGRLSALSSDTIIENLKTRPESQIEFFIRRLQEILGIDFPQQTLTLSWQEIGEMSKHGISFGSHTCNHVILTRLSREEINYQIRDSRDKLIKHRINFIPILAYPNGNYNGPVVEEVKKAGYEAAVTTEFGVNDENTNPYKLKRINVHNDITSTIPMFACHISGIFRTLSKAKLNKRNKPNKLNKLK